MFSNGFYGNKSPLTRRVAVEERRVRDGVGNSHAQAEAAAGTSYGDYGPTGSPDPTIFLPVSLVSLGTDPLLSNSSPFSTACMNLSKPRLNLMLYTLISGKPSIASPIMSFFSNSGVLASEAISGAGSKCIYPTECNVLLLTAIPLVCYLCYLVFPKGAFLVHFYSFSLLMTSLSLSTRPPCSSLLTMPNVSVPLLTHLTALFYKMTSSGFWIGVTNENFISTFPSVLLFVFPMEPQFPLSLPIAWVIKI